MALAGILSAGGCTSSSSKDRSASQGLASDHAADVVVGAASATAGEGAVEAGALEAGVPEAGVPEPAEPAEPSYEPREEDLVTPHQPLENPEAIVGFLDALAAIDAGEQRVVRVVHMGASMIGADDLPAVMRGRFQTRFGDGGAGLVLMSRYSDNYLHHWVKLEAEGWSHCYIAYKCLPDGHYGLGGTAFWASSGATTTITTRKKTPGNQASEFELWYLARPGGGQVEISIDDGEPQIIDTRAELMEDRFHAMHVERGPHQVQVRAVGHGTSRLYGVMLETDGPGVVWDQFSKLGVFTKRVLEWDAEHLAGQIGHRDPELIVFTYGGNDLRRVANGKLDQAQYVAEYSAVVKHMRAGKPEASCLITSITDRGRSLTFEILPEHVEVIVEGQRQVAEAEGCAFFNTYAAMGGGGSLKKWKHASPPLAAEDLKHLNHRGRVRVGGWLYDALISAYVERRQAQPRE